MKSIANGKFLTKLQNVNSSQALKSADNLDEYFVHGVKAGGGVGTASALTNRKLNLNKSS